MSNIIYNIRFKASRDVWYDGKVTVDSTLIYGKGKDITRDIITDQVRDRYFGENSPVYGKLLDYYVTSVERESAEAELVEADV